jgi:hypothetical protein
MLKRTHIINYIADRPLPTPPSPAPIPESKFLSEMLQTGQLIEIPGWTSVAMQML